MEQSNWWMKGGHYICTGGHMSDLLIDAQLHFFQKLHDHRVVIKLPSKYHNTIHNSTLFFTYLLFILIYFILYSSSTYTCLKFLDLLLHFSKYWDCAKSRSTSKTHHCKNGELFGLGYKYHIYYLSTSHKNSYFFGDNI